MRMAWRSRSSELAARGFETSTPVSFTKTVVTIKKINNRKTTSIRGEISMLPEFSVLVLWRNLRMRVELGAWSLELGV
jgi:hypothetical protein